MLHHSFWVLRGTIPACHLSSQWVRPSPSPTAPGDRLSGHPIARYGSSKSRVWEFSPFSAACKIPSLGDDRRKPQDLSFWVLRGTIPACHLSSQWIRPSASPSAPGDRRSGQPIARYGSTKSRVCDFSPFSAAWKFPSLGDDRRKPQDPSFWVLRGTILACQLSSQWVRPSPSPSASGDRRSGLLIARYGPSKSRVWDFSSFSAAWKIPSLGDDRRKRQAFWTVEAKVLGGNAWWMGWVP